MIWLIVYLACLLAGKGGGGHLAGNLTGNLTLRAEREVAR